MLIMICDVQFRIMQEFKNKFALSIIELRRIPIILIRDEKKDRTPK
jgi:hypothetical protein